MACYDWLTSHLEDLSNKHLEDKVGTKNNVRSIIFWISFYKRFLTRSVTCLVLDMFWFNLQQKTSVNFSLKQLEVSGA